MMWFARRDQGVEEGGQNCHSKFYQEESLDANSRAMPKESDDEGH